MLFRRRLERWIEELYVELENDRPLTSSGATLTLPAAVTDLRGWILDHRIYSTIQHPDWNQVLGDFRASADKAGSLLLDSASGSLSEILEQLDNLFIPSATPHRWGIDPTVRERIATLLAKFDAKFDSSDVLVACWRELTASCRDISRKSEEVSTIRDTLWALAKRRNLDLSRTGALSHLASVMTDNPDAVQTELDIAAGVSHEPRPLTHQPTGVSVSERLAICETVLRREVERGDCIVWLRLAPASLPRYELSHGQVTFYNASYLSSALRDPANAAALFGVPPTEAIASKGFSPVIPEGEALWEDDWNMVYARVCLGDHEIHNAVETARTLVRALIAVNHPTPGTWTLLEGSLGFINGEWASLFGWGPKDYPDDDIYHPQNDWMDRDIELMTRHGRSLNQQSMHDLQDALNMSGALKAATSSSPHAVVMAAVRAIEHVNVWVTQGDKTWVAFANHFFKEVLSRVWFVGQVGRTMSAAMYMRSDPSLDLDARAELQLIDSGLRRYQPSGHEIFDVRGSADHIARTAALFEKHWLARHLNELAAVMRTPAKRYARLKELGHRFDAQLHRLSRLRNAAIHGGPISEDACASVEAFASLLAHRSLDEAMFALLSGKTIAQHLLDFRDTEHGRWESVRGGGGIDALFAQPET